ncbi:hypothetical protein ACW95P_04915 [Candidatus Mycoplasma pogonae]
MPVNYYTKELNIINNIIKNLINIDIDILINDKNFISEEVSKIEDLQSYSIKKLPLKEQKTLMAIYSLYSDLNNIFFKENAKVTKNYYENEIENNKFKLIAEKGKNLYKENIYSDTEFKF